MSKDCDLGIVCSLVAVQGRYADGGPQIMNMSTVFLQAKGRTGYVQTT